MKTEKREQEIIKAKEIAIQLDKQLEKELQEEQVNLCPECSFFCEQRFIDGQCK